MLKRSELMPRQGPEGDCAAKERDPDRHAQKPSICDEVQAAQVEECQEGRRGECENVDATEGAEDGAEEGAALDEVATWVVDGVTEEDGTGVSEGGALVLDTTGALSAGLLTGTLADAESVGAMGGVADGIEMGGADTEEDDWA